MKHQAVVTLCFVSLALLAGCNEDPIGTLSVVPTPMVASLTYPPVSTFEESCARCHGPQGSFFGEGFGHGSEEELRQSVKDMMEGPSFLTPSEADVNAMTDYMQALDQQQPYLVVTAWDPNTMTLQGEATPQASIIVEGHPDHQAQADANGTWVLQDLPQDWSGTLRIQ